MTIRTSLLVSASTALVYEPMVYERTTLRDDFACIPMGGINCGRMDPNFREAFERGKTRILKRYPNAEFWFEEKPGWQAWGVAQP